MTEIAMIKERGRLAPIDQMASEDLAQYSDGTEVIVTIESKINIRQWRLLQVLFSKVAEASELFQDREQAKNHLLCRVHHGAWHVNEATGTTFFVPGSTSPRNFKDQATFNRLFNRIIYVVVSEVVPGMSESALREEIMTIVNPDSRAA